LDAERLSKVLRRVMDYLLVACPDAVRQEGSDAWSAHRKMMEESR